MCGFVGLLDIENRYDFKLDNVMKLMQHRGPDKQKVVNIREGMELGFARLSIIDLAGGEQPMENNSGNIIMVFNGEIYNYIELKEKLKAKGYIFYTKSDTEVLLYMYEEYGMSMLEAIQGMFAVAIVDKNKKESYLLRDRLGIKPLYYCMKTGVCGFASEIKPLLNMPFISRKISSDSVGEFLNYEYIQAPNTIFTDIKKVMPGHYMKLTESGVEDIQYWDCNCIQEIDTDIEECKKKTIGELKKSIELHLRSDVPLGAFLSGGIDSGLLVALASEQVSSLDTYTLRFENGEFDESALAELVAGRYKTHHHCYTVKSQDMKKLLPEMLWFCDEPLGDSGLLPNFIINKLSAEDGIKVVLNGAGGDELFAGYTYYFENEKERKINAIPQIAKIASKGFRRIRPDLADKIERSLSYLESPIEHMITCETVFTNHLADRLLAHNYIGNNIKKDYYQRYRKEGLNALLYTDIKTYLTDDLMLLSDRTCMANSVEGRVPFLHHPLVEYSLSIPEYIKAPNGQKKWLLKKIAEDYLPSELINAPKRGFSSPIIHWGGGEFGKFTYEILNSDRCLERNVWNSIELKKYVSNKKNYSCDFPRLYLLLILELYFRVHVDGNYTLKEEISLEEIYGK